MKGREGDRKRIEVCDRGYLRYGSYLEFAMGQVRNGGVWSAVKKAYGRIRKYTLITAVLKTVVTVVSLLEKSALLLLALTALLFLLPIALIPLISAVIFSVFKYFKMHGQVSEWLENAERITVYLTSAEFFCEGERRRETAGWKNRIGYADNRGKTMQNDGNEVENRSLFARCAMAEAEEYTHPVIAVCGDRFFVAKWGGFNLLVIKCDYFFILRKYYFKDKKVSFIVLD